MLAEARIAELPRIQPEDAAAVPFWLDDGKSVAPDVPQDRVRLGLLRTAEEVMQRDAIQATLGLGAMQVFTARTGTNFLLKPQEADALGGLWAQEKTSPVPGIVGDEEADIAQIRADTTIDETTRLALIDARRGQGQFRAALIRRWRNACAASGIGVLQILRASHCKPWSEASNAERLNPSNGLLLAAHLDALFDSGLISFADDGSMLISSKVTEPDRARLGIPCPLRADLTPVEREFMAYHRNAKFQR